MAKQAAPKSSIPVVPKRTDGYVTKIAPKTVFRTRQDIATWKAALRQAENMDAPKRTKLHLLYKDISLDALLSSQLHNRRSITVSAPFALRKGDTPDEQTTAMVASLPWFAQLIGHIVDSEAFGTTVIEFVTDKTGVLRPVLLPRQNIIPESGLLLFDETATTGIPFRDAKEYGTWLLEFGEPSNLGTLNKAVPHVLFKRFAQSCWSELCEIYGIPPRVMKTNTQDAAMLTRAEQMMTDMGAAAWFIIDETETFEFAKGASTTGDVYGNLIALCNNEMSLLFSGAVIGQDTKNGNFSKETVSVEQLMRLAESDKRLVEGYMNTLVLPALFRIGLIPDGLVFAFLPQEDTEELYTRTIGFMQYLEPDLEWINLKFGTQFTGLKQSSGGTGANFQPDPKKK